jgi:nucleotide-binding universal stress UspA family protein
MKIMAAFDGTKFSESILHQLTLMAAIPGAEFTLIAVAHEPDAKLRRRGRPRPIGVTNPMGAGDAFVVGVSEPTFAEDKTQAIERRMSELEGYLLGLAHQLPAGTACNIEAHVSDNAAQVIIDRAKEDGIDVIAMTTRSPGRLAHAIFGSTTEAVVRSSVAPVLLVHPLVHPKE